MVRIINFIRLKKNVNKNFSAFKTIKLFLKTNENKPRVFLKIKKHETLKKYNQSIIKNYNIYTIQVM